MHDDIAIDILAQPSVETRKENDSLRLLLGSYESHFARMRQQLQQLIPNGLISRDMDGAAFFITLSPTHLNFPIATLPDPPPPSSSALLLLQSIIGRVRVIQCARFFF